MQKSMQETPTHYTETELQDIHQKHKSEAMAKVNG